MTPTFRTAGKPAFRNASLAALLLSASALAGCAGHIPPPEISYDDAAPAVLSADPVGPRALFVGQLGKGHDSSVFDVRTSLPRTCDSCDGTHVSLTMGTPPPSHLRFGSDVGGTRRRRREHHPITSVAIENRCPAMLSDRN